MIITGALLLNNSVGGELYLKPPTPKKTTMQIQANRDNNHNIPELERKINSEQEHEQARSEEELNQAKTIGMLAREGILALDSDEEPIQETETVQTESGELESISDEANNGTIAGKITSLDQDATKSGGRCCCCSKCCSKSSLLRNIPFLLYCLIVCGLQGCIQCVLIFLPSCGKELGASRQQEALLLTSFGVADMVGRFVFGFVFDIKLLRPRRQILFVCIAAGFGACSILMAASNTYVALLVLTCLTAFLQGGAHSQRATNVPELVKPKQMSTAVGFSFFFMGVGNFYGPFVGGNMLLSHNRAIISIYSTCRK